MSFQRLSRRLLAIIVLVALGIGSAHGQRIAKYGADFLAGGIDARALGMGGAYVSLADDVSAGFWNPAGLSHTQYPEISYMHVERFSGAVSFDYGGVSLPVTEQSTIAISAFRSGVNDIVNTLQAWNPDRGVPLGSFESRITRFSAADWALFVSYSRQLNDKASVGVNFKGIQRSIGDFAEAWGYSVDVAAQYRTGPYRFGITVQDVSTMLQSWSVNPSAFDVNCTDPVTDQPFDACTDAQGNVIQGNAGRFEAVFDQAIPSGGTALVLPVIRLGSGAVWPVGNGHQVTVAFDTDVRPNGQQSFAPNVGEVSFHPRLGAAFSYKGVAELRGGVQRLQVGNGIGFEVAPSMGAGLDVAQVSLDFSFGDFTGLVSQDLGFSYRISAQLQFEQPGLKREGEDE